MILLTILKLLFIQSCSLPDTFGEPNTPANALIFYLVYGTSILIVVGVFLLFLWFTIKPREKSENHIKRKILLDL